jgi:diacylglycerol O-acyltransferase / wax synthase
MAVSMMAMPGTSSSRHREAMAKVDTAWLRMERPTNLMMIAGVLVLATPLSIRRLRTLVRDRFLAYHRFGQKAVEGEGGPWWEHDPELDLDWHVRRVELPDADGQGALESLASSLASTPLDHARPLWRFDLVEHYRGGSALVIRIHHCYADGIALVQVMLSLTDLQPRAQRAPAQRAAPADERSTDHPSRFDRVMRFGGKVIDKGMQLYRDPALAGVVAKESSAIAAELAHALALADDPQTALKGPLGEHKRCAWAEPIDLDEIKAVGRGTVCTVNDVVLACAAGALRGYLLGRGEAVEGLSIRATVPVNLRPAGAATSLGNHFGLVFLDLPIGEPNPVRRLEIVAANMCELKSSRQAVVTYGLLTALGMAPALVQQMALDMLSRKASAVATNVPGPSLPLYMGGSRIDEMMFWVPQSGSIGLGISILSYNGRVHFGLICDALRIPDPAAIIARIRPEFEKLLYATLMEDWDEPVRADRCAATLDHYG